MKIRSAEFLAAVAIISSATALQLREHLFSHDAAATDTQPAAASLTLCGMSRHGVIPAACEAMRGDEPAEARKPGDHHDNNDARRRELDHAPESARVKPQVWV